MTRLNDGLMRSQKQATSRRKYIGVFDSGFGGLTILRGIVRELPEYDYIYLGDTARAPYGARSPGVVHEFTRQAVDFLFRSGCELIILACNTASSDALRRLQREYLPAYYPGKKVLGVLIPCAEEAARTTVSKRVGVIATSGTVASGAFPRELAKLDPDIRVFQKACPLLVPLIEAGEHRTPAARSILRKYLSPLMAKRIDTLILGCTHYGIMEKDIKKILGARVHVISGESAVPPKLLDYLERHPDIERKLGKNRAALFYSTDLSDAFESLGSGFFGRRLHARKAALQ